MFKLSFENFGKEEELRGLSKLGGQGIVPDAGGEDLGDPNHTLEMP